MDQREIRREIDIDAATRVAGWLEAKLAWRSVWLAAELHMTAHAEGIDLATWMCHPAVRPVFAGSDFQFPGTSRFVRVYHRPDEGPLPVVGDGGEDVVVS